jgi:16S rRNA processing protein RimM
VAATVTEASHKRDADRLARIDGTPQNELVTVGRVGKPHGIEGAFVVEDASDAPERFAEGAELLVDGEPTRIVESKRAGGRPVIRLERAVARGTALAVPRASLPEPASDSYYVFQLRGLEVVDEDGKRLGRVNDVGHYPANDVLELDTGLDLPLVEACVREIDLAGGCILVTRGFAAPG